MPDLFAKPDPPEQAPQPPSGGVDQATRPRDIRAVQVVGGAVVVLAGAVVGSLAGHLPTLLGAVVGAVVTGACGVIYQRAATRSGTQTRAIGPVPAALIALVLGVAALTAIEVGRGTSFAGGARTTIDGVIGGPGLPQQPPSPTAGVIPTTATVPTSPAPTSEPTTAVPTPSLPATETPTVVPSPTPGPRPTTPVPTPTVTTTKPGPIPTEPTPVVPPN